MNNNQDKLNDIVYDGGIKKIDNTKKSLLLILILTLLLVCQVLFLGLTINTQNSRCSTPCCWAIECEDCEDNTCTCKYCKNGEKECDSYETVECLNPNYEKESEN